MSQLSYIPPTSPDDPLPDELVALFIRAVAKVTSAFKELLEQVFPKCKPEENDFPLDDIRSWLHKWGLDFQKYEQRYDGAGEMRLCLYNWTLHLLRYWAAHPEARAACAVDFGFWHDLEDEHRVRSDSSRVTVKLESWNPNHEDFPDYAARLRKQFEEFLQEQRRTEEAWLAYDNAKPHKTRTRAHDPALNFEFVALHVCLKWSDGKIANRYRLPDEPVKKARERVKKARERLMVDLRLVT